MFMPEYRCGKEIKDQISTIVDEWKRHRRPELVQRCIFVTGVPGVGKSELLRWITQKYKGVYLDLEAPNDARNPDVFARQQQIAIRDKLGQSYGIICVDHVPSRVNESIDIFYDRVLSPLLELPYLFFFALRNKNQFDIGGNIPRSEDLTMRGFARSQMQHWIRAFRQGGRNAGHCKLYKDRFQDVEEHWPLMIQRTCNEGIRYDVLQDGLQYWIERAEAELGEDSRQIIALAKKLHMVNLNDSQEVEKILANEDNTTLTPMMIRIWFQSLGWWQLEGAGRNPDEIQCQTTMENGWTTIADGLIQALIAQEAQR